MPVARSILPERFADDRHGAMERGLARAGYAVQRGFALPTSSADVLVTWTRHRGDREAQCRRFEAAGGRVVVAEEPHLKGLVEGRERLFSLSLHDHQRHWRVGGPERWSGLGIAVAPWRKPGGRIGPIVVRDQRGIGSTAMASPPGWGEATVARLRALSGRAALLRPHPKRAAAGAPPLAAQLADAWCLVTWASHEGVEALLMGVPVVWCAPFGFVRAACGTRLEDVILPPQPERLPVLETFAWSQWRPSEIENGEAFRWLLA